MQMLNYVAFCRALPSWLATTAFISLTVASVLTMGCQSNAPRSGIVAVVSSDMEVPKDLDRVRITATTPDGAQSQWDLPEAAGALQLPRAVNVIDGAAPGTKVKLAAAGWNKGVLRVVFEAELEVQPTRLLVPVPLNWLCAGAVKPQAENDDAMVQSACADDETCQQGQCQKRALEATTLRPFKGTIDSYVDELDACFDSARCFANEIEVTAVDADCSFALPRVGKGLNVAMELPPGQDGACDGARCLIVLDGFAMTAGWTQVGDRVVLPAAVCNKQKQGAIVRLVLSDECPTKTVSVPLCGSGPMSKPRDAGAGASSDAGMHTADAGVGLMADAAAWPPDAAVIGPPPDCTGPQACTNNSACCAMTPDAAIPSPRTALYRAEGNVRDQWSVMPEGAWRQVGQAEAKPTYVTGAKGQAFDINNEAGFVEIPDHALLNGPNLTVRVYFRVNWDHNKGDNAQWNINASLWQVILSKGTPEAPQFGFFLQPGVAGYSLNVQIGTAAGGATLVSNVYPILLHRWYQAILSISGSNIKLVVDDNAAVEGTLQGPRTVGGGAPLMLGESATSPGALRFFGSIDEVRIVNL